jgi:hypothetical protein
MQRAESLGPGEHALGIELGAEPHHVPRLVIVAWYGHDLLIRRSMPPVRSVRQNP